MINFPNNPKVGDAFSNAGTIYTCILVNPIVWNAAPAAAPISDAPLDGKTYGRNTAAWKALDKTDVGLNNVDNTADINKPISNPTATALSGKQATIPMGSTSQYWRGDQTWQVLNASAAGAVAKAGDIMTGNLTIQPPTGSAVLTIAKPTTADYAQIVGVKAGAALWYMHMGGNTDNFGIFRVPDGGGAPTSIAIDRNSGAIDMYGRLGTNGDIVTSNGMISVTGQLRCATGMGMYYDGGNANYLDMGAGIGSAWAWQWARNTGALTWLNASSAGIFSIDGSGNVWSNGNISASAAMSAQTTIWGGGRITGAAADVAALYGSGGSSGIYTECGGTSSFRATQGGAMVHPGQGYKVASYADAGGGTFACYMTMGNPNWNDCWHQAIHVSGQWAGIRFWSSNGNLVDHYMSNGGSWGSVKAASFDVQSDERTKLEVAALSQQHNAFMAIQPISWKRNFDAKEGGVPEPERSSYADVDGTVHEPPPIDPIIYDDPNKIHWGFSAQNLMGAVRTAVQGDVTAVAKDGKPITAGVNPVPIIAITVLEVQALWNKIAEMETTISQLKGQQ